LLDHDLGVYLWVHLMTASKPISKYHWLPPASDSPISLDHCLGVYLWVHLILFIRHTLNCSQALFTVSQDIPCVEWAILGSYIDIQMRIQTEYMSFNSCWIISSSYDFHVLQQRF